LAFSKGREALFGHYPGNAFSVRGVLTASFLVTVASVAVYWQTSYRTITWWDNASYSLAAVTLGIPAPPGSLLLTLLGWIVTKLPLGVSDIFSLNLFAGVLAAFTSGLVCFIAMKLIQRTGQIKAIESREGSFVVVLAGSVLGSLAIAFSETLWLHAIKFTPYILTALWRCCAGGNVLIRQKHSDGYF